MSKQFQSSSGLLAGCNHQCVGRRANRKGFQSSSGLLAGCNHPRSTGSRALGRGFNPHPAFWPDATGTGHLMRQRVWRFNPHPAFWPDATTGLPECGCEDRSVSILIRPSGRMQHLYGWLYGLRTDGFNPHPAFWPDATPWASASTLAATGFNPHPAFWPDATRRLHSLQRGHGGCFNPHPAFWPDATPCGPALRPGLPVSILIRPSGRMQRLYLNFLSVLGEPPDASLPICFHCPDHSLPPATIQLRTRTSKLQWLRHWVRVRPPAVP